MNKPPDPTLTLDTSFPRHSQRPSLGAVDDTPSLFMSSSHLVYPFWRQSQSISCIDEYPSCTYRSLYFESSEHHYQAISCEILWVMVYWKPPASILFIMAEEEKPFSESRQICWVLYQISHLTSPSHMNLHCQPPPTVFMAIRYSGGLIFHSVCKVTNSQRLPRSSWEPTRSTGDFLLQSKDAKVKGYTYPHSSKSGVLIPFSQYDILLCVSVRTTDLLSICWVYICAMCLRSTPPSPLHCFLCFKSLILMSYLSPRSPLSLNSDSNGSSSNLQNDVPISHHTVQSSVPALLDGIEPNHSAQSTEPIRSTFSDSLKFGFRSYGSGSQPTVESKPGL